MLHNEQLIYAGDAIRKAVPLEGLDGDGIPYTLIIDIPFTEMLQVV